MAKTTILVTEENLAEFIKSSVHSAFKELQVLSRPDNTLLTQQQAAELLHISVPTLLKWKEKRLIPFTQINRKIYFKRSEVLQALEKLSSKNG